MARFQTAPPKTRPSLGIVVLAAGNGNRMRSDLPKPMLQLGGFTMLEHVLKTAMQVLREESDQLVLVCSPSNIDLYKDLLQNRYPKLQYVLQEVQDGSASAFELGALQCQTDFVMNLFGDVPLISVATLKNLLRQFKLDTGASGKGLGVLTMDLDEPAGYGRVVRNKNYRVLEIIEHIEADTEQLRIKEVFAGVLVGHRDILIDALSQTQFHDSTSERHLPDVVKFFAGSEGTKNTLAVKTDDPLEVSGANTRAQLHALERYLQKRTAEGLLEQGVGLADQSRLDVRGHLHCGENVWIDVNVVIEGECTLGDNVEIGANVVLKDCFIAANTRVLPFTYIESSTIGSHCELGPYARLRPGSDLQDHVEIGNFVEVKNSQLGQHTKAKHVSTVLDADIGSHVNLSAGLVFANFNGIEKGRITIADGAMIGSGSTICAPCTIGEDAYIAAGTTITRDVEPNRLAINEGRKQKDLRIPNKISAHGQRRRDKSTDS